MQKSYHNTILHEYAIKYVVCVSSSSISRQKSIKFGIYIPHSIPGGPEIIKMEEAPGLHFITGSRRQLCWQNLFIFPISFRVNVKWNLPMGPAAGPAWITKNKQERR